MAWGETGTTLSGTRLSFLPKIAKGLLGWGGLGAAGIWERRDWLAEQAQKYPGLLGSNPLLALGTALKAGEHKFGASQRKADTLAEMQSGYPKHASGALPVAGFNKSMEDSVKKAATEVDDEEEDPFNYNQLFIASILKGLKQKPPATASGRASGTYIPKPDLPRMSDYDSNKTYWNIG